MFAFLRRIFINKFFHFDKVIGSLIQTLDLDININNGFVNIDLIKMLLEKSDERIKELEDRVNVLEQERVQFVPLDEFNALKEKALTEDDLATDDDVDAIFESDKA